MQLITDQANIFFSQGKSSVHYITYSLGSCANYASPQLDYMTGVLPTLIVAIWRVAFTVMTFFTTVVK